MGDNDCGKSAILRALRWVALNDWEGKAGEQITWEEHRCDVWLDVDSGVIHRFRDGEENCYELSGNEFRAFGRGVPDTVKNFLGLSVDNFQGQHDQAFWLMLNSGQAAQALNEIFNLSAVDSAMSNVAGELRHARAMESVSRERLQEVKEQKKVLAWTKRADIALKKLEEMQRQIQEEEKHVSWLADRLFQWQKCLTLQERAGAVVALGEEVIRFSEEVESLEYQILLVKKLIQQREELCRLEKRLEARQKQLAEWMKGRCPLCQRLP